MGEEGRERAVLDHLLRLAIAAIFRDRLSGLDLSGFTEVFAEGAWWRPASWSPRRGAALPAGHRAGPVQGLDRLGYDDAATRGQIAAAAEFALEGCT